MKAGKPKLWMMALLVLCMVFAPITAQAGTASGPTGTASLTFSYDTFSWTVYPIFTPSTYSTTNTSGTIDIYRIVGGSEVHYKLINAGHINPGTTFYTTSSRPCGLPAGTYKAYLRTFVTRYSPTITISMPVVSETFTLTSSTESTPCYNNF